MPTYTITDVNDNGRATVIGNTWTPAAAETIALTTLHRAGLRFTSLPTRTTTLGPAQSTLFQSIFLHITLSSGAAPAQSVDIRMLDETDPAAYATGSTMVNRTSILTPLATLSLPAGPYVLTVDIPIKGADLARVHSRNGWNGKLALWFAVKENVSLLSSLSAFPPQLLTTEVGVDTGLSGAEWAGHGVREDAKTGQYVPRDMALRDGYSRRQWVHPDNYDPPDWETERRRRPRVNEGRTLQERD